MLQEEHMMYGAAVTAQIVVLTLGRDDLERLFHALGGALMDLQGPGSQLLDHSVSLDRGKGLIEISVTTTAEDAGEAEELAEQFIRQAIQSTGGNVREADAAAGISVTSRELVAV
jgi:hypothetical protein